MFVLQLLTVLALSKTSCTENRPDNPEGLGYTGCTDRTQSGKKCLPWAKNQEDGVVAGDNYCRNPGGRRRMWCRTKQAPGWEYCNARITCGNSTEECPIVDQCWWPICVGGQCSTEQLPVNTPCDDGNSSTIHDVCTVGGFCAGVDPCEGKKCAAKNFCHSDGVCIDGYCTEPKLPDGSLCSTGLGMNNEQCVDGMCIGTVTCDSGRDFNSTQCTGLDASSCSDNDDADAVPTVISLTGLTCTDSNPQTNDRCSSEGQCISTCDGRNSGCGIKLSLNDGHCKKDSDCKGDLVCAGVGSCARINAFRSQAWPKENEYSWDTQDRCCVENNQCSNVTCEGECGNSSPFSPCSCSCNANCKDQFNCCPDYEMKCYDHEFTTTCDCSGQCGKHSVQPCGCSCNPHTCVKEGNCCDNALDQCDYSYFPSYPTADCTCGEGQCGGGNDCGCVCDIRCNRCQFENLDQNSEVCERCCDVEQVCTFSLPEVDLTGCTCRGADNQCRAQWNADCGTCACDHLCLVHDDCCQDKFFFCGGEADIDKCTCEGSCGNDLADCLGCSCSPSCEMDNTCCPDYTQFCNTKHVIIPLTPKEKKTRREKLVARNYEDNTYIYLASMAAIGFFVYFHRRTLYKKFFGKNNK